MHYQISQKVKKKCSKPLNIFYEKRHAWTTLLPHIMSPPRNQTKPSVECRKKPLNTSIFKNFKTTSHITTCYYTKTYSIFCKKKEKTKGDQKTPKNFPKILKIIIILKPEMNVTCKIDESMQLIHLCLCKLKIKHAHTEYFWIPSQTPQISAKGKDSDHTFFSLNCLYSGCTEVSRCMQNEWERWRV